MRNTTRKVIREGYHMANQEHLDILKQGDKVWNKWRGEHIEIEPDINEANLTETIFNKASIGFTRFGNVDLSKAKGLETTIHHTSSSIGIDTIYASKGNIPEVFLKGAGVDDTFIAYIRSLVGKPFEY